MTSNQCCSADGCSKAAYSRGMCCAHYKRFLKARPRGIARTRPVAESDPVLTARISLTEFLTSLAAACPPLPGARCRDQTELFDRTVGERGRQKDAREARATAVAICRGCPALRPCRGWLDSLPPGERPIGVIAGLVATASTH